MTDPAVLAVAAGLFGLLIGSFLNVCIHRWPRDLSVVRPRSACTSCGRTIAWYDNVPLLSFLILGGRCRNCGGRISWTYPLVELMTGAFFAYFAATEGISLSSAKDCVFVSILIGLIFSDLGTYLLPDEFTIGGLAAGLAFALFVPLPPSVFGLAAELAGFRPGLRAVSFGEALTGGLIPAAGMWLLGWLFEKFRDKEYLGFGDVKMIAMMGAFLGLSGVVTALLLGSLAGSIGGLVYLRITGKDPATHYFPFALFLGCAALIVVAAHGGITGWYEQLLR